MALSIKARNLKTIFLVTTPRTAVFILFANLFKRGQRRRVPPPLVEKPSHHIQVLNKDEADRCKQEGVDNSLYLEPRQARQEMWREVDLYQGRDKFGRCRIKVYHGWQSAK